jgi:flagellar protein FliO/FliZ
LKRIALILCALVALGAGAVAVAQNGPEAPSGAAAGVVGTARAVDETALTIGDAAAPSAEGTRPAGPSTLAYFIRMVVVLAIVVAAIYLVFRFLRRATRPQAAGDDSIKVLASAPLGPGKALHIVSVGSRAYLVGAAESAVSLIAEIEDREYIDALALRASTAPKAKGAGFADLLGSLLGGKGKKASGRGASAFLAGQRDRLRKL